MADNTDKNTTTNNTENKDQNQNNNSDSNSSTDKKDTPKPQTEKEETAEERAIREKKEAEAKAAEAEREKQINDHYAQIANNVFKGDTSTDNIKAGDHIKHINLTLPEMKMTDVGCRVAVGLDNIMTEDIKQEFNTYNYFGIFDSFDDMYVPSYDENGREIFEGKDTINAQTAAIKNNGVPNNRKKTQNGYKVTTGSPAVRSLFNRAGQVLIGNLNIDKNKNKELYWKAVRNTASEWRVALNVPLMDSPATRKRIREHSGCTIKELVKASKAGDLGRAKYSYADFMYCKYLGRISNNYLITLRRFPIPPGDCITTSGTGKTRSSGRRGTRKMEGESQATEDMGCLVTWLGTPGNDMNNVLKYSVTMPFEEKEAGWEDIQVDGDSSQGFLPSIASAFNDSYRQQYCAGYGGTAFNSWAGKFFGGQASGYDAKSFANFRDKNKIYGPVDVVKKIYKRSENGGLDFKQNITIVFDYELRSYNGINPRQAMLDLISNILNVTYTSGGWWGGGYRGGGMAQSSIFTNLNIFKFDGTFTGFCDSLQKDYQTLTANLASQVQSAGGILQYCLKLLNNIGGMLMGGLLNKMGRPARAMMHSLLSEQPVGFWHLMVGNPHHPIMSVGNMILKNTTIEHYGPLGLDDFPTGLKVTCELDRGKPRDNREVEKMYMNGNDRIYSSIGPKVTDMYQKAAQYKAELLSESSAETKGVDELLNLSNRLEEMTANLDSWSGDKIWEGFTADEQGQILSKLADTDWYNLLYNWFGQADLYSISLAAQEIEYGSYKKKDTELKAYNPDKVETAQASTTMLKKAFNRHDWKEDATMDVSVTHVDGDGNVHKVYVQVESGEKDAFLNDYKKYLESGDLSLISKYVSEDNKNENSLSYSAVNGKEGKLDASKVAVYKQPEPPAQPVVPNDENPGANPGSNVSVGEEDKTNNNIMTPTVLKPGESVWNPRLSTEVYYGKPLYHKIKVADKKYQSCPEVLNNLVQKQIPNLPKSNPLYKGIANMPPKLLSVAWPSFEAIWKQIIARNKEITFVKLTSWRTESNTTKYKRHPMGLAVDINSTQNGWIKSKSREGEYWSGKTLVYKEHVKTSTIWSKTKNRDTWVKQPGAAIIQAFTDHGWSWGMYNCGPDLMHWNALFKEVYSTSNWDDNGVS